MANKSLPADCWKPLKIFSDTRPVSDILEETSNKLTTLETSIKQHSQVDLEEQEYTAEMKFFYKGVRERASKSESERMETISFVAEREENLRLYEYENRSRKKTKEEIELLALYKRPIEFPKTTLPTSKCDSLNCKLCNGEFARVVITDLEIQNAGGIEQVYPITDVNMSIANPLFSIVNVEEDCHLEKRHDSKLDTASQEREEW
eukprot:CAMPEP_0195511066 /NCGR_PEP_ID=MMETSP0794_2-20130614/3520_1 /TAXON_ID=515487 /ORGANISM="Stephanopyxis turris, Strain CCMP 815" /LENGTH=204 /DNA_ID=CAMNT_0040638609 /DNA_START=472 /DNA_END=1083 /DNA_ORIENTATION=-